MYKYSSRLHKTPFGAVREGQNVHITFPVTHDVWVKSVRMYLRKGEFVREIPLPFTRDDGQITYFECDFHIDTWGVYYYRFEVNLEGGGVHYVGRDKFGAALCGEMLPEWQITVLDGSYVAPQFEDGSVIYHIFADRFCRVGNTPFVRGKQKEWGEAVTVQEADGSYRADDFYGGNARGIISKLDYLQSLGVNVIYLSPIFEAASNHRYDTGDYMKIDPLFGTEQDFADLVHEAKRHGMGVMLDGVFNHSGADSRYFNLFGNYPTVGAANSKASQYYGWYTFYDYPTKYQCWWGCTVVPTFNKSNAECREFLFGTDGVVQKWTKCGILGWRLDVADELPTDLLDDLVCAVKAVNPNAVIVGEVWEDASTKVSYGTLRPYLTKGQLDGVMNYPFKQAILDFANGGNAWDAVATIMDIVENYPAEMLNRSMTLIGTHDTVRAITALSGVDCGGSTKAQRAGIKITGDVYKTAKQRLKMASLLQYVLPGVPSVYYGDEAGMQGYEDPLNRGCYPWGGEDADLVGHYKALGGVRKRFAKQLSGTTEVCALGDNVLCVKRTAMGKTLCVCLNNSMEFRTVNLPEGTDVFNGAATGGSVTLPPLGYTVTVCDK